MKIAVVYNRESQRVINLFGIPNREHYGLKSIKRITDALKANGHSVMAVEGDKDLIDRLEEFMPRVLKGERPGMVFNLSYGIQGQARYTHVPGMLEMAGIPYLGSGPLAHSLALDKVVAKMIFKQHGLPTPDFAVLKDMDTPLPDMRFPLIVKPKNEAVSFGIQVVQNHQELKDAAEAVFKKFNQPALVEQFIDGREINVGLLGNHPPETLPPAELDFGMGPNIYTHEDKMRQSGRTIGIISPAKLTAEQTQRAQELAIKAFQVLGCYDCARIDMRMDKDGNFYILEINSLPSLGEHGSYVQGALAVGLDFKALVNRLVDVASTRYFGTPSPPELTTEGKDLKDIVFKYITGRRDRIEKRLSFWTNISSRTHDPVGIQTAVKEAKASLEKYSLKSCPEFTDDLSVWCWQTKKGFSNGTLFIDHMDVPLALDVPGTTFRRDPENLYGEGIGSSRAPFVMFEFILGALKHAKLIKKMPLGILLYTDEGRDCRYSKHLIQKAASKAKQVFVLHPGQAGDFVITQRRGQRKYTLTMEGKSLKPAHTIKNPEPLIWFTQTLKEISLLSSHKEKISISPIDIKSTAFPMRLPHKISAALLLTYLDEKKASNLENKMKEILKQKEYRWQLSLVSDRPPLKERENSIRLANRLFSLAKEWEIPLNKVSSVWPTAAGLVPQKVPVICGVGPVAVRLHEPSEAVQRVSMIQRSLIISQFLLNEIS